MKASAACFSSCCFCFSFSSSTAALCSAFSFCFLIISASLCSFSFIFCLCLSSSFLFLSSGNDHPIKFVQCNCTILKCNKDLFSHYCPRHMPKRQKYMYISISIQYYSIIQTAIKGDERAPQDTPSHIIKRYNFLKKSFRLRCFV